MRGNEFGAEPPPKNSCPSPQPLTNGLGETVPIPYLPLAPGTGTSQPAWSTECAACQGMSKKRARHTHVSAGLSCHRAVLLGFVLRVHPKLVKQYQIWGSLVAFHLKVFNKVPEFFMHSRETYKVNLNSGLNYKAKGCIANNANTAACDH